MANRLLKFGVPIISQAIQPGSTMKPVRHQTGVCGIEPLRPPPRPKPAPPEKFPSHLLRPPCLKGSEPGRFPPDCKGMKGFYCPIERIKYKYPPFSENIDFVPSGENECWWTKPRICDPPDMDDGITLNI